MISIQIMNDNRVPVQDAFEPAADAPTYGSCRAGFPAQPTGTLWAPVTSRVRCAATKRPANRRRCEGRFAPQQNRPAAPHASPGSAIGGRRERASRRRLQLFEATPHAVISRTPTLHQTRIMIGNALRACAAPLLAAAVLAAPASAQQTGQSGVPHPRDVLGFEPGADYHLATYDQLLSYYSRLAASSARVRLDTIGTSVLGRPLPLLIISSE